ncbi:hypothetical protein FACS189498_3710 [Spirochaetia bacterium]|nr:hypothetical protein FACS189498_3710 [Spirochaetia bacterium]
MVEGLKWQARFLAICLSLTAFAHANDSAYPAALAGQQVTVSEMRQSGQWVQSLESHPSDLKANGWLMAKASAPVKRRGKS